MIYAKLGSVSHATMRNEDLIPRFMDALQDLHNELATHGKDELECVSLSQRITDLLAQVEKNQTTPNYYKTEESDYDLQDLWDLLNEFAPPYTYFGAHEGDGADYGFWPSYDTLEEDSRYGEVLKVSDLSEIPDDATGYVALVSDHGNLTLYEIEIPHKKFGFRKASNNLKEIWSVV
jgi:hypothetical protein